MKNLLILFSVIPIFAGLVVANLFGFRRLYKTTELSLDLETILEVLTKKYSKLEYEFKSRVWAGSPVDKQGVALIEERYRNSKSSKEISRQLVHLGLSGLWSDHQKLIKWRLKCVKMGYVIPPLSMLGAVLAVVVGRLPAMWAIVIVGVVIAGCIIFLWFSRAIEKESASQMINLIERTRVLSRLSEEEALIEQIHAWTWVTIIPGTAISFLMNNKKA